jgi:hypothetical protein
MHFQLLLFAFAFALTTTARGESSQHGNFSRPHWLNATTPSAQSPLTTTFGYITTALSSSGFGPTISLPANSSYQNCGTKLVTANGTSTCASYLNFTILSTSENAPAPPFPFASSSLSYGMKSSTRYTSTSVLRFKPSVLSTPTLILQDNSTTTLSSTTGSGPFSFDMKNGTTSFLGASPTASYDSTVIETTTEMVAISPADSVGSITSLVSTTSSVTTNSPITDSDNRTAGSVHVGPYFFVIDHGTTSFYGASPTESYDSTVIETTTVTVQ